jgi:uncharacterized RDD family membrane protein YckC
LVDFGIAEAGVATMSSAAQREEMAGEPSFLATGTEGGAALKQMAAERLASHRNRRAALAANQAEQEARVRERMDATRREHGGASSRVREAVEARYRQSVSYREFLAVEAERALEQAQAEAEVAALTARAVAQAQIELLEELEQWNLEPKLEPKKVEQKRHEPKRPSQLADMAMGARESMAEPPLLSVVEAAPGGREFGPGLKVRLHEDLGRRTEGNGQPPAVEPVRAQRRSVEERDELAQEFRELDREIEFRLAPEFQEHVIETTPIQANIIEFPRQLVAPRKARPRLAEGPLREDGSPEPQLRIFEVEPEQISVEPVAENRGAPEWQSLLLGAAAPGTVSHAAARSDLTAGADVELHTARLTRRMLAMAVDTVCVGAGFAGFAVVAVKMAGPALRGTELPLLGGAAAVALVVFAGMYQALFFTLNEATPGMRYARVGLCTFADGNPSRRAMRRRLAMSVLAIAPGGLGLLWMVLDSDGLGWHDRMSRMYPREY